MTVFRRQSLRAAVIQSRIQQGEKDENWRHALELLQRAMEHRPQLVVLPEAFATGVNFIILKQMAEPIPDGPTCSRLRQLAADLGIHLIAGVLELGDDGHVFDSAVLFDPAGELLGRYRRRFLWVGERNYVAAGAAPLVVDSELGRIGFLVGYDLCFPEACSHFLHQDVDIAVCPASVFERLNFNARHLALARAMDHHCYFLFANAVGFHQFANMTYDGHSGIFADPYFLQIQLAEAAEPGLGRLAEVGPGEGFAVADLHLQDLAQAKRKKLPFRGDAQHTLHRHPPAPTNRQSEPAVAGSKEASC